MDTKSIALKRNDEIHKIKELTPAEHWNKIKEIGETLKIQVQDLQDMLNNSFPEPQWSEQ